MHLTNEQWEVVSPYILRPRRLLDRRGRPRRNERDILDGILWILKTGARWRDLPERYPSYQTCHRWYQEWVRRGVLQKILTSLARDMERRGRIHLKECFIDGSFASAKKGGSGLVRRSAERAAKSWPLRTLALFLSPSVWPLLLRTRSRWWRQRLPDDLPERIRRYSLVTGHTIATRSTDGWPTSVSR